MINVKLEPLQFKKPIVEIVINNYNKTIIIHKHQKINPVQ